VAPKLNPLLLLSRRATVIRRPKSSHVNASVLLDGSCAVISPIASIGLPAGFVTTGVPRGSLSVPVVACWFKCARLSWAYCFYLKMKKLSSYPT